MNDLQELMEHATPAEVAAVRVSVVLFLVAALVSPSLVVWLADRRASVGFGEHFVDFVMVELLGCSFLILLPFKEVLKKWLYAEGRSRAARLAVSVLWVGGGLGVLALLMPQAFFALTQRETAVSTIEWFRDTGVTMLALLPQVLSLGPYVWAMRRLVARVPQTETAS